MEFDILEDGEPAQSVYFPREPGTSVTYIHGFAFKPTVNVVNGTMSVRVYKDSTVVDRHVVGGTLIASASCPGVLVTP